MPGLEVEPRQSATDANARLLAERWLRPSQGFSTEKEVDPFTIGAELRCQSAGVVQAPGRIRTTERQTQQQRADLVGRFAEWRGEVDIDADEIATDTQLCWLCCGLVGRWDIDIDHEVGRALHHR